VWEAPFRRDQKKKETSRVEENRPWDNSYFQDQNASQKTAQISTEPNREVQKSRFAKGGRTERDGQKVLECYAG